jgi:hypothetical protein
VTADLVVMPAPALTRSHPEGYILAAYMASGT